IVSGLNRLVSDATKLLEEYDITSAARAIERFVVEDLSLWYIRRSRRRFQRPEAAGDLEEASATLGFVLLTLSKLVAPFIPFFGEALYQKILYSSSGFSVQDSVHLADWPKVVIKRGEESLNEEMDEVRQVVSQALSERAKVQIKVRQPLASLKIQNPKSKIKNKKELLDLIKEEVNVKEILFDDQIKNAVELDTVITPELREEGIVREVVRQIQEMRKEAGLRPSDKILVRYTSSENLDKILNKNRSAILKEARIKDLVSGGEKMAQSGQKELKIDQETVSLAIKKVK
ncbi:MAG: class I tRNA ligase family protein, partial [Candidatus Nealsonbacteria bacterium]|nr:class I tRNA ligase family protein [Candidatus Nealsonbacteria bacterium]